MKNPAIPSLYTKGSTIKQSDALIEDCLTVLNVNNNPTDKTSKVSQILVPILEERDLVFKPAQVVIGGERNENTLSLAGYQRRDD
jgi:hypothetical protein